MKALTASLLIGRILPMMCLLVFSTGAVLAEPEGTWEEAVRSLPEQLDTDEDCRTAWDKVWPWAKAGNGEARLTLANLQLLFGLSPPGSPADGIAAARRTLVLLVNADVSEDYEYYHTREVGFRLMSELFEEIFGKQIAEFIECTAINSHDECVKQAESVGMTPPFADFAEEIDVMATLRGDRSVTCRFYHSFE